MPKATTLRTGLTATPHLEVPTSSARTRPPACSGRACQPVRQGESWPAHSCWLRTWCALKCRQNRAQGSVDSLHLAVRSNHCSARQRCLEGCCWREGRRSEARRRRHAGGSCQRRLSARSPRGRSPAPPPASSGTVALPARECQRLHWPLPRLPSAASYLKVVPCLLVYARVLGIPSYEYRSGTVVPAAPPAPPAPNAAAPAGNLPDRASEQAAGVSVCCRRCGQARSRARPAHAACRACR